MTYRQSEMYNCAKYLKNLPLQAVSSKGNLQVVDKCRKCARLFGKQFLMNGYIIIIMSFKMLF